MTQRKKCSKCKETKPFSNFWKASAKKDGLQSQCKDCLRILKKKYQNTPKGRENKRAAAKRYRSQPRIKKYEKARLSVYRKSPKGKKWRKQYVKAKIYTLSDDYLIYLISNQYELDKEDITQGMVEIKRATLQAKRTVNESMQ